MIRNLYIVTLAALLVMLSFAYGQEQAQGREGGDYISRQSVPYLLAMPSRHAVHKAIYPVTPMRVKCNNGPAWASTRCAYGYPLRNPTAFVEIRYVRKHLRDGTYGAFEPRAASIWHCPVACVQVID